MSSKTHRLYVALRSLSVLVSFQIMSSFISPAMWVLFEEASVMNRVARLATSDTALAVWWLCSATLVAPFVVMQLFVPCCKARRVITKTANYGMIGGALAWVFMAFLARNLDYGFAIWNFLFNAAVALTMAALLANNLNNDQKNKEQL